MEFGDKVCDHADDPCEMFMQPRPTADFRENGEMVRLRSEACSRIGLRAGIEMMYFWTENHVDDGKIKAFSAHVHGIDH